MRTKTIDRVSIAALAAALVLASSAPASAQTQRMGDRPYQGLFGAGGANPNVKHSLEFSVSVTEAYDDDVPTGLTPGFVGSAVGSPADNVVVGGYSTMFLGDALYHRRVSMWDVGASLSSVVRYYNELKEFRASSFVGSAGFNATLSRATSVSLNQTVNYSPSYLYNLFPSATPVEPGELPVNGTDYAAVDSESYAYTTNAVWDQRITPRNQLTVTGDYVYTDFSSRQTLFRDLRSTAVSADYTRKISRNVGLSAGYQYRVGDYGYVRQSQSREHGINLGLDLEKRLSPTRSAVFGISGGVRALYAPQIPLDRVIEDDEVFPESRREYAYMEATAGYQFGRSWYIGGTARRSVDYVAGFPEPVLTGGFTADLSGYLAERIELEASGGYANGTSALSATRLPFDSYTARTRVRFGLARSLASYVEYIYYYYLFTDQRQIVESERLTGLRRNGVRVGLTVWVPAFRK